ncbi:putative arrestin-related trafficking adapter [Sphaerulina musiva]
MAASYRSSTYGLLYYDPAKHHNESSKPQRVYRPRRVGPGRVCIKLIDPKRDRDGLHVRTPILAQDTTPLKRESINLKLASTRENARRFLKSVISTTPASTTQSEQKKDNSWKRRSWSPANRSNSQQSSEAGVGTGEALGSLTGAARPAEGVAGTQPAESGAGTVLPTSAMRSNFRHSIGGPVNAHLQRSRMSSSAQNGSTPSLQSFSSSGHDSTSSPRVRSTNIGNTVIPNLNLDDEKPIASGNGVAVGIHLAEPVLFLQGFENSDNQPGNTAMLRGGLHLRVSKSAKIKGITLKFKGTAITKWPEGIPPKKVEFEERDTIMSHTWPFFNAQFENAEKGTNADHVQLFKDTASTVTRLDPLGRSAENHSSLTLNSREAKKLALSVNQSRSFGKGETPGGPTVATKGYRTFLPGDYVYNFEMPIDSRLPETIDVELGTVKYELEAVIERAGAFRSNLVGNKEVTIIRAPAEGSLECVEPIAISRNWEDQLHYDIVISGKSFPLGTQVPIAFKLTPLAKVQCHRIKVLVTENIEYFCSNKRVHRMEPTRKVQLFEKRADSAPTSTFPGSTMRVTSGGGIPHNQRAAAARGEDVTPIDNTNLLGNLDTDAAIGPTEMEFNVQLPSCHTMKERDRTQRLHFDTTYQNIQVHHWIKIVMRLSKPDVNDPTKRRHFEISIDSPFHILSCRATQQNTSLPAYTSPESGPLSTTLTECGCPGAAQRRNSPPNLALHALNTQQFSLRNSLDSMSPGLTRPPTVHARDAHIGRPQTIDRPIHLLRAPSFNPPPFSEEEPPPPLITPPPQYDSIASPTSGLADYFARLGDAYDDDDSSGEDDSRPGRVNVPLTPGGRINRSVDLGRGWNPLATQMPLALPRRRML